MDKSLIAMKAVEASRVLDRVCKWWDEGGHQATIKALETCHFNGLVAKAPKTRGHLWWKRETTERERIRWAEDALADTSSYMSTGWSTRYASRLEMGRFYDEMYEIKKLRLAVSNTRDELTVFVDARLWASLHSSKWGAGK